MKKFFEKYDLVKVSGLLLIIVAILTWLLPGDYFYYGDINANDITRLGWQEFWQYSLLAMYWFVVLITFLFVLGGFYQVLSKRPGYQKLIKNISEKLKGCEIPFVIIISLVFAVLGGLVTEFFPLLALIPIVITILNRLKVDKISSFCATFGGILVGALGSTYSTKVLGSFTDTFGIETKDVLLTQAIVFVIAFLAFAAFLFLRMKKQDKKKFETYDRYELETVNNSKKAPKTWPYVVGIILFTLTLVLAYLPWETWEITWFQTATDWVNGLSIAKVPIVKYICSEFKAFGTWDVFHIQFVMIFVTLLIKIFGKMSFDEMCECYGEGFKKIGSTVVIVLIIYATLAIAYYCPTVPAMVEWLAARTSTFNPFFAFLSALLSTIFGVEAQYITFLGGAYYISIFKEAGISLTLIFQSVYGVLGFCIPTSAVLMIGLSYLGISYKEWMKYIWKYLLAMIVVLTTIVLIMA